MNYIPLKTILNEFAISTGEQYFSEDEILQWATSCINLIGSYKLNAVSIKLLEVENYEATLPDKIAAIEEVHIYKGTTNNLGFAVKEFVTKLEDGCQLKTEIIKPDCQECCVKDVVVEANQALLNLMPWLKYSRVVETGSSTSVFSNKHHNSIVPLTQKRHEPIHYTNEDWYVIKGNKIKVKQKDGVIIFVYSHKPEDEDGYLLLLNSDALINAIVAYIEYKKAYIEYRVNRSNADGNFFLLAERLKNQAMSTARATLNTLTWEEAKALIPVATSISPYYKAMTNART